MASGASASARSPSTNCTGVRDIIARSTAASAGRSSDGLGGLFHFGRIATRGLDKNAGTASLRLLWEPLFWHLQTVSAYVWTILYSGLLPRQPNARPSGSILGQGSENRWLLVVAWGYP